MEVWKEAMQFAGSNLSAGACDHAAECKSALIAQVAKKNARPSVTGRAFKKAG